MTASAQLSTLMVVRRVLARTVRYVLRDPVLVLGLAVLAALLVLGLPGPTSAASPPAPAADDVVEQHLRALRDRDPVALFSALAPSMQRALEQRFGRPGLAAAVALFREQERNGERVVEYRRIARYETVQGDTIYFAVVLAERGGERREFPYTIVVGPEGKITHIE